MKRNPEENARAVPVECGALSTLDLPSISTRPSTNKLGDGDAWQEVSLEEPDGSGELLAKLGWSLVRRRSDGCWVTDALSWHDFREGFRPGIGEEEWDRSFG